MKTVIALSAVLASSAVAAQDCATIKSGSIVDAGGSVIQLGFDQWGKNYHSRLFKGSYCDNYQQASWCQAYNDTQVNMKWNDAWLSNKDCDGDGALDRHYGHDSYRGSGAVLWQKQEYSVINELGEEHLRTYMSTIKAAPVEAKTTLVGATPFFYVEDNLGNVDMLGEVIWGQFYIEQEKLITTESDGTLWTNHRNEKKVLAP